MKLSIVFLIIALSIYATQAYDGATVVTYGIDNPSTGVDITDGTTFPKYPTNNLSNNGCGGAQDRTRVRDLNEGSNAVTNSSGAYSFQAPPGAVLDMSPRVMCNGNILVSPSQSNYAGKIIYASSVRYDGLAKAAKKEIAEIEDLQDPDIPAGTAVASKKEIAENVIEDEITSRGGGAVAFYGTAWTPGMVLSSHNAFGIVGSVRDSYAKYHSVRQIYHASNDSTMYYYPYPACNYLKGFQGIDTNSDWRFELKVRTNVSGLSAWNDTTSKVIQNSYFGTLRCTQTTTSSGTTLLAQFCPDASNCSFTTYNYCSYSSTDYSGCRYASTNFDYFDTQYRGGKNWYYFNQSGTSNITCIPHYGAYGSCNVNCTGKCGTQDGYKYRSNSCSGGNSSASCSVTCPTTWSAWSACNATCYTTDCGWKSGTQSRTSNCSETQTQGCSVNCGECGGIFAGILYQQGKRELQ
jgi:hypothetical protein